MLDLIYRPDARPVARTNSVKALKTCRLEGAFPSALWHCWLSHRVTAEHLTPQPTVSSCQSVAVCQSEERRCFVHVVTNRASGTATTLRTFTRPLWLVCMCVCVPIRSLQFRATRRRRLKTCLECCWLTWVRCLASPSYIRSQPGRVNRLPTLARSLQWVFTSCCPPC